ncbi:MAG: hypothetical protein WDA07_13615 [Leucobacter sp.]
MLSTTPTEGDSSEEAHSWEIPAYNLDAFKSKVDQANLKLARAGLDARFEVAYEEFGKEVRKGGLVTDDGIVVIEGTVATEPWVRASMVGPLRLAHGHFTFVAKLVPEEAGITVHSAPGQELGGYAPAGTTHCDHCGVDRDRSRLYLIRDERDGSILQLGHSCIELYTGVAPKGLWALTFDQDLSRLSEPREGGFSPRVLGSRIDAVLAYSFAHSDRGRSYVPASSYDPSTAGMVRTSLFGDISKMTDPDRQYFTAKGREAALYLEDTALLAAIKASVSETAEDSDYGRNLRVILSGETVSGRNVGILASLVKVYARQQQLEVEREANPVTDGFIGKIGERVKNVRATAKTVRYWDGDYGTTTFLVAIADDGHVIVWKASKRLEIAAGDKFTIAAATVKAQEQYQGTDQSVITRPSKFEVLGV